MDAKSRSQATLNLCTEIIAGVNKVLSLKKKMYLM